LINEADSQIRLYDLSKDISEKNNLVDSYKTKVDSMALEIEQWEMNMIKPLWPRIVNYVYRDGKEKTRFGF
jgi:23S rRNA maturation-related 3'-5' exoribonuclease YhaM